MLLEKPQNKAVEQILTDCYNAGRDAVLKAIEDYMEMANKNSEIAYCVTFYLWYQQHAKDYEMKFKVGE